MDTHYDILILGGGTAGLTVASQLADRIGGRHIGIVEPSLKHYYILPGSHRPRQADHG